MPLTTFLNLPEERKKEITRVCFEEFAHNDYESASLGRIIKRLGVAKGSFYRYFENKQDLYVYLAKTGKGIIFSLIDKYFRDPNKPFFEVWPEYFMELIQSEEKYPQYLHFLARIPDSKKQLLVEDKHKSVREMRLDFIGELLAFHQKTGEIRTDVDIELLSAVFSHLQRGFREYLARKYKMVSSEDTSNINPLLELPAEEIVSSLNMFMKILKAAIGREEE